MIYDKKITNNRQFKSCQSALEFSDSLPLSYLTALRELLLGMMLKLGKILLFFNRLR